MNNINSEPQGRLVTVHMPSAHDGVGIALRETYRPQRCALPDDMVNLLDRLNAFN